MVSYVFVFWLVFFSCCFIQIFMNFLYCFYLYVHMLEGMHLFPWFLNAFVDICVISFFFRWYLFWLCSTKSACYWCGWRYMCGIFQKLFWKFIFSFSKWKERNWTWKIFFFIVQEENSSGVWIWRFVFWFCFDYLFIMILRLFCLDWEIEFSVFLFFWLRLIVESCGFFPIFCCFFSVCLLFDFLEIFFREKIFNEEEACWLFIMWKWSWFEKSEAIQSWALLPNWHERLELLLLFYLFVCSKFFSVVFLKECFECHVWRKYSFIFSWCGCAPRSPSRCFDCEWIWIFPQNSSAPWNDEDISRFLPVWKEVSSNWDFEIWMCSGWYHWWRECQVHSRT